MCVDKKMILEYIKHINKIFLIQDQEEDHQKDGLTSSKRILACPSWLQKEMRSIEVDGGKIVSEVQGVDMTCAIKSSKSRIRRLVQKQPSRGILKKRSSENMHQIYRRTPMPKCGFNKFAEQLYWNCTLARVFPCKFAAYIQNTFSLKSQFSMSVLL